MAAGQTYVNARFRATRRMLPQGGRMDIDGASRWIESTTTEMRYLALQENAVHLLATIDDPAHRAMWGQRLFGKRYSRDIAPLIYKLAPFT